MPLGKICKVLTNLDKFRLISTNLDHFKPIYTSLNLTLPLYPQPQCHQGRRERSAISICHLGTVSGTKVHIDAFHLFSIWFKQHHTTYNHVKCWHFLSKHSKAWAVRGSIIPCDRLKNLLWVTLASIPGLYDVTIINI